MKTHKPPMYKRMGFPEIEKFRRGEASKDEVLNLVMEFVNLNGYYYQPLVSYTISLEQEIHRLRQENEFLTRQLQEVD